MELGVAMSWIEAMMVESRGVRMGSGMAGVGDRNWCLPELSSINVYYGPIILSITYLQLLWRVSLSLILMTLRAVTGS